VAGKHRWYMMMMMVMMMMMMYVSEGVSEVSE